MAGIPGWEAAARSRRVGERVNLKSLPDYWIAPQKHSIEARNDVLRIQGEIAAEIGPSERKQLHELKDRLAGMREAGEPIEALSPDEERVLLEANRSLEHRAALYRVVLSGGVGDHNFDDESGKRVEWGPEIVEKCLQYDELATEMFAIIQEWNRPLAQGSEQGSSKP